MQTSLKVRFDKLSTLVSHKSSLNQFSRNLLERISRARKYSDVGALLARA